MARLKQSVLSAIRPIHQRYRKQKINLFLHTIGLEGSYHRLLDVGGGAGITGEFLPLYQKFREVVVVNLSLSGLSDQHGTIVREMVADARELPFGDQEFDWVFSNAVIEHVGDWKEQRRFANEVRRVSRYGYFVACPNKIFPIEPHTLLPFYQFFPLALQKAVAPYSPGYLKKWEEIHLLTRSQLKELFPEASVSALGFPMIGNNLVARFKRG